MEKNWGDTPSATLNAGKRRQTQAKQRGRPLTIIIKPKRAENCRRVRERKANERETFTSTPLPT